MGSYTTSFKYDRIKKAMLAVTGFGPTWVKMLMVEVDIARPSIGLLQDRCEIGSGAREPLRAILAKEGIEKSEALQSLPRKLILLRDRMHNYFGKSAGKHFKKVL